jgi:predicted metal-dependent phosphoesterase TrpH
MKKWIDLHLHTNHSDGTSSAAELLEIVRAKKLSAFSVTDHDTLAGYWAVRSLISEDDPELIPGLELSVMADGGDLHLLAYLFDPDNEPLKAALERFRERRNLRARLIVERLNERKIDISFEEVQNIAGKAAIGRPHIADTMVRLKAVGSYEEAFEKYIRNGGPAYVAKESFAPEGAISMIRRAGGVTVLAHPIIDNTARHVEMLAGLGLDGIEIYHPVHKQSDIKKLKHLAERYHLLISGGSDFHGRSHRYSMVGSQNVPEELLDKLKQRSAQKREKH